MTGTSRNGADERKDSGIIAEQGEIHVPGTRSQGAGGRGQIAITVLTLRYFSGE